MSYCANCKAEIKDLSQKFCEKCGSPIPSSVRQSEETSTTIASTPTIDSGLQKYDRPGGLFDINRNYFILKEKYWDI